jgi:hypothetical protein
MVPDCRAVSACPLAEGNVRESLWVALSSVDMSEDYQRQGLLRIVMPVHTFRDGLADPIERSGHDDEGLGTVGVVKLN